LGFAPADPQTQRLLSAAGYEPEPDRTQPKPKDPTSVRVQPVRRQQHAKALGDYIQRYLDDRDAAYGTTKFGTIVVPWQERTVRFSINTEGDAVHIYANLPFRAPAPGDGRREEYFAFLAYFTYRFITALSCDVEDGETRLEYTFVIGESARIPYDVLDEVMSYFRGDYEMAVRGLAFVIASRHDARQALDDARTETLASNALDLRNDSTDHPAGVAASDQAVTASPAAAEA
jgi:hypothetical protein